jgi:hypothetical protein
MPGDSISQKQLAPFLIDPLYVARVWGYHDLRPWYDYVVGQVDGSAAGK